MRSYGGKSQIIPMTIDMFRELIQGSKQAVNKPNSDNIREFLDKTISDIEDSSDESNWSDSMNTNVAEFMKAAIEGSSSRI